MTNVVLTDYWLHFEATVEIKSLQDLTAAWVDITEFVDLGDSNVYRRSSSNAGVNAICRITVRDNTVIQPDSVARIFITAINASGAKDVYSYGWYVLSKPAQNIDVGGTNAVTWTGDDITTLLDSPIGYTIIAEQALQTNSFIAILLADAIGIDLRLNLVHVDWSGLPTNELVSLGDWVWSLTNAHTWRFVMNEVLVRSGARRLWMKRDGQLFSDMLTQPSLRPVTLTLDAHNIKSIVGSKLAASADIKNWPNRWIFIRDDISQDAESIEGEDHIIIVTNLDTGPAALNAIGQSRSTMRRVESTSVEAFIRQSHAIAEEELYPVETISLNIVPVPHLWHQDIISVNVPEAGWDNVRGMLLETNYRLDGKQDMRVKIERLT